MPISAVKRTRAELDKQRSLDRQRSLIQGQRRFSPSGAVVVSYPEPREITSAKHRSRLNADRATQELDHYRKERRVVERRITELSTEIERIGLQLDRFRITLQDRRSRSADGSNERQKQKQKQKQKHIFELQTLYATERLQKQEELLHLTDHLQEINENMENILRKYEDTRTLADIKRGGKFTCKRKRMRTCTRTCKRIRTLRYK
jgi:hypothetical protein